MTNDINKEGNLGHWDGFLDEIENIYKRYVILPEYSSVALSLWTVNTYSYDFFTISPRLLISSPDKRCGKTRLLSIMSRLVYAPIFISNITAASIYHFLKIAKGAFLIDEGDTFIIGNDALNGILNSGHTKDAAYVIRAVSNGNDYKAAKFSTWAPFAIAMINRPKDTLIDRSVMVRMRRKKADETIERLRLDQEDIFKETKEKISQWAQAHEAQLRASDPITPSELHDRAADNWRPLLAIADLIGGEWPQKARQAAIALSGREFEEDASSFQIQLLEDIREVFEERETDKLFTTSILEELNARDDRPWQEWKDYRSLTPRQMAQLLTEFKIKSRNIWIGDKQNKGYALEDFQDAFERYLPKKSVPESQNNIETKQDARTDNAEDNGGPK